MAIPTTQCARIGLAGCILLSTSPRSNPESEHNDDRTRSSPRILAGVTDRRNDVRCRAWQSNRANESDQGGIHVRWPNVWSHLPDKPKILRRSWPTGP